MGVKRMIDKENKTQWDEKHKDLINLLYGLLVGTGIVIAAFWQIFPHLTQDGELSRDEMIFIAVLIIIGVTASMPHIFKQILSAFIRRRKNGANGA